MLALLLALAMVFALCACGNTAAAPAPTAEATPEAAADAAPAEEKTLDYPTQPITMMVAWTAGGGSDLLTRAIAADAPEFIGVNMNVTNREGAGGTIGFAEAVDYANDGYNLLYSTSGVFSAQPLLREVEYSIDDFDFICGVGEKPMSVVVPASWGVTNLQEWIDYLNANGIEAVIGTSGSAGSIPAFGMRLSSPSFRSLASVHTTLSTTPAQARSFPRCSPARSTAASSIRTRQSPMLIPATSPCLPSQRLSAPQTSPRSQPSRSRALTSSFPSLRAI